MTEERNAQGPGELSPVFVSHATRPRNIGSLEHPDGLGEYAHGCGDTVQVFLRVRDNKVIQIRYLPQSCLNTVACVSLASTLVEGRSPIEARRNLRAEAIAEALGGLPPGELHCAEIATRAICAALDDYIRSSREPWRRLYR